MSYYLTQKFDKDKNDKEKSSKSQIIAIVILSIVVVLLVSAIVFYFLVYYKKGRKKIANELEEEFEYTPKEKNDDNNDN